MFERYAGMFELDVIQHNNKTYQHQADVVLHSSCAGMFKICAGMFELDVIQHSCKTHQYS